MRPPCFPSGQIRMTWPHAGTFYNIVLNDAFVAAIYKYSIAPQIIHFISTDHNVILSAPDNDTTLIKAFNSVILNKNIIDRRCSALVSCPSAFTLNINKDTTAVITGIFGIAPHLAPDIMNVTVFYSDMLYILVISSGYYHNTLASNTKFGRSTACNFNIVYFPPWLVCKSYPGTFWPWYINNRPVVTAIAAKNYGFTFFTGSLRFKLSVPGFSRFKKNYITRKKNNLVYLIQCLPGCINRQSCICIATWRRDEIYLWLTAQINYD